MNIFFKVIATLCVLLLVAIMVYDGILTFTPEYIHSLSMITLIGSGLATLVVVFFIIMLIRDIWLPIINEYNETN